MGIFGSAVFAIMNILVGVNTAKVFGGSTAMGGVMAGILSSPQLAQITLFGEALQPGRGGVIAVLLVVALMCWIERKFRTLLPESLELILNPLLTTIITGVIAIVALQPLGGWISESIAHGASGLSIAAVFWSVPCWREPSCRWYLPGFIRDWCPSMLNWSGARL